MNFIYYGILEVMAVASYIMLAGIGYLLYEIYKAILAQTERMVAPWDEEEEEADEIAQRYDKMGKG